MNEGTRRNKRIFWTRLDVIIILIILGGLFALFFPVYLRMNEVFKKNSCESNMKEIGTALALYYGDFNSTLPSSYLIGKDSSWNAVRCRDFARFGWTDYLLPYMKHKDVLWCPSDPLRVADPAKRTGDIGTSYYWKAAVDRAWFGGTDPDGKKWVCRKVDDYKYDADQVIFYERASWHWEEEDKGLSEGVRIICTFLDSHVSVKLLSTAGNAVGSSDPVCIGEPAWFNYDFLKNKQLSKDYHYDPRVYGDNLE